MYCSHCGRQIQPGSSFCPACGHALAGAAPAALAGAARAGLVRPRHGRLIAGVCAAFANSYGWDVSVVRILAAAILFFSAGTAALAYFILWIVIPDARYALPARTSTGTSA